MSENSVLQQFLDAGLLPIEDEQQLSYLTETASEIAAFLIANPSEIIPYTLIALDPECFEEDPVLQNVENALKVHWKLLRGYYKNQRPTSLLRAIIVEALSQIGIQNPQAAALIWLSGGSYFEYAPLKDTQKALCQKLLLQMEAIFEQNATEVKSVKKTQSQAKNIDNKTLKIEAPDDDALFLEWSAILGPNMKTKNAANKQLEWRSIEASHNPNPHWQGQSYTNQEWNYEFALRAAAFIGEIYRNIGELSESLNEQLKVLLVSNRQLLSAITENDRVSQINEYKTNLLWWKETLYSPTLHCSYRNKKLTPVLAGIAMAHDLAQITARIYPISVDYLLAETFSNLSQNQDNFSSKITLAGLFEIVAADENHDTLQKVVKDVKTNKGRLTLLEFIQESVYGRIRRLNDIDNRLGLSVDCELEVRDIIIWCFRDLQAKKIAGGGVQ